MQNQAAIEVSASFDCRYTFQDSLGSTPYESTIDAGFIFSMKPDRILGRSIHWAFEGFGPFHMRRVKVRMGDDNALKSSQRFNLANMRYLSPFRRQR